MNPTREYTMKSYTKERTRILTDDEIWNMHKQEQDSRMYVISGRDIRYLCKALEAPTVDAFLKII